MPCAYVGGARALPGSTCHGLTPWYGSAGAGVSRDTSVQVSSCFTALGAGARACWGLPPGRLGVSAPACPETVLPSASEAPVSRSRVATRDQVKVPLPPRARTPRARTMIAAGLMVRAPGGDGKGTTGSPIPSPTGPRPASRPSSGSPCPRRRGCRSRRRRCSRGSCGSR
ncbi:hypothetical protein SAFG77S_05393 [Streptomyces afghaniensis]